MKGRSDLTYIEFVDLYNRDLKNISKHIRKGQHLMILLSAIWPEEEMRISSVHYYDRTDINCYYNDDMIPNTLKHLEEIWE